MDDFEKEIKAGFLDEASQLLLEAEQCFLILESSPEDQKNLEKIFRIAHNLKGSAKAVGFDSLGEFAHQFENYLLKLKDGTLQVTNSAVGLLLRCNDLISKHIQELRADFAIKISGGDLLREIESQLSGNAAPAPVATAAPTPQEEVVLDVPSADAFAPEAEVIVLRDKKPVQAAPPASSDESIRISLKKLEKLIDYVGEMVILQSMVQEQTVTLSSLPLRKTVHQLRKVTKEVQEISMSLRMLPMKQTFQKMQRIVRDTSSSLGKKVDFAQEGEETELDKTILESISDPLVHLIRNAIDHGIEKAEDRIINGKPEAGTVKLSAYNQSGSLIIEVQDDGAGLDADRLTKKAIEKGILKPGTKLSPEDAYQLIFHAGFSTKAQATEVSGRGVGMDVVRTNIEQLQGEVKITTELGKGTCFRIRLPLTLAIADGMTVVSGDRQFIVPLAHVHESLRPKKENITFVSGMGEILSLREEEIPVFHLSQMLGVKTELRPAWESTVIVVRSTGKPFAVVVDDILGQNQIVIKKLSAEHSRLPGFSGSAILGDGRPCLILELPELINHTAKSAVRRAA